MAGNTLDSAEHAQATSIMIAHPWLAPCRQRHHSKQVVWLAGVGHHPWALFPCRQRQYLEKTVDSLKHKLHRDSEQHRTENVRIMQVGWPPAQICVHVLSPRACCAQPDIILLYLACGPVQAPDAAGATGVPWNLPT